MATKVAILGTVPNSRIMAPYRDADWDIWCCSAGNSQTAAPERVSEWYELHSLVDCRGVENSQWWPNYVQWMRTLKIPVWMQEPNDEVPAARVFPRKELLKRWGPGKGRTNWFTSSITWMMAFALLRSLENEKAGLPFYDTIGIFGVDMASAEEHYTGQKAGIHRWTEILYDHGRKTIIPLESTLAFGYPLYGYAESSRMGRALLLREMECRHNVVQIEQTIQRLMMEAAGLKGTIEQVVFDRRTYVSGLDDIEIGEVVEDTAWMPQPQKFSMESISSNINKGTLPPSEAFTDNGTGVLVPAQLGTTAVPTTMDFPDNPDAALLTNRKKRGNGRAEKEG